MICRITSAAPCTTQSRNDFDELAAFWPDMPDLDGVDVFSQYPIAGEPAEEENDDGREQQD